MTPFSLSRIIIIPLIIALFVSGSVQDVFADAEITPGDIIQDITLTDPVINSTSSATFSGTVIFTGSPDDAPATYWFEYSASSSFPALSTTATTGGFVYSPIAETITLDPEIVTGLSPGVMYVRLVIQGGASGTSFNRSDPKTFNTFSDTTAPSVPTGITVTANSTSQITVSWTSSTDDVAVTGYKVYRGGVQVTDTSSLSFVNTGLTASTSYCYTVSAYDAIPNTSAQSSSVCATTQAEATPTPTPTPTPTATPTPTPAITSTSSSDSGNGGGGGGGSEEPTPTPKPVKKGRVLGTSSRSYTCSVLPFITPSFMNIFGFEPNFPEGDFWSYIVKEGLKQDTTSLVTSFQNSLYNGKTYNEKYSVVNTAINDRCINKKLIKKMPSLFSKVYGRSPTTDEHGYWLRRLMRIDKISEPDLYGAMQWHQLHDRDHRQDSNIVHYLKNIQ